MDAYNDDKHLSILEILKQLGFQIIVAGHDPNLQLDTRSCSLFSFNHVTHSSKNKQLFEEVKLMRQEENEGITYIPWAEFEPCMIKNSQNLKFLSDYIRQCSLYLSTPYKSYSTFKEYLLAQLDINRANSYPLEVNTSIETKLKHYNEKIHCFFRRIDKQTIGKKVIGEIACSSPLTKFRKE